MRLFSIFFIISQRQARPPQACRKSYSVLAECYPNHLGGESKGYPVLAYVEECSAGQPESPPKTKINHC